MTARHAALVALAVLASSCSSKGQGRAPADPPPSPSSLPSAAPQPQPSPPPPAEAAKLSITAITPSTGTADGVDAAAAAPGAPAKLLGDQDRALLESLGTDTRVRGSGVGVAVLGDFVGGGTAPGATRSVPAVGHGTSQGDFGGFTADEIDRVIRMRAGLLRACYQKELARKPDLGGKVVVRFTIAADGTVAEITLDDARTTLDDDAVTSCIRRQFQKLRFPAKGPAKVTYPLVFASA